jgi:diaminopimelate epimerase
MIFYKTSSFGNDFIEIDCRELPAGAAKKGILAREICDRQRGVGADGVVFYRLAGRKCHFEIYNRDGGAAELSGNGMAGLAAVLFKRRLAASPLKLQAAIGSRRVELLGRDGAVFQLAVEIGLPDFANRDFFPFLDERPGPYRVDDLEFHPVSVGNPHAVVVFRKMPPAAQLLELGKKLEGHPMFPKRVNVEFVHSTSGASSPKGTAALRPASCRVYFYERGVGPTQASSTGSAAVFAVLRRLGLAADHLAIDSGADTIQVSWQDGIIIRNVTRLVCRGEYFL